MDGFCDTTRFIRETISARLSPVRVCFSSKSSAGAWQIRAEQIAATRTNWEAINSPSQKEIEQFDLFCICKKADERLILKIRDQKKPIVFDIVDSWAQPADGLKVQDLRTAIGFFSEKWSRINADAYIFPTRKMQLDLGHLVDSSITIYHHAWPLLPVNPIRTSVKRIGYVGGEYLGDWERRIQDACKRRGIVFKKNPSDYSDLDVTVLVRGGEHGSFLARNYKSNVKIANAYGSGTPALVHVDEMAAHDTDCGDILFFSDLPGSFERQLDRLINNYGLRKRIHEAFLHESKCYSISRCAEYFDLFFQQVFRSHVIRNK